MCALCFWLDLQPFSGLSESWTSSLFAINVCEAEMTKCKAACDSKNQVGANMLSSLKNKGDFFFQLYRLNCTPCQTKHMQITCQCSLPGFLGVYLTSLPSNLKLIVQKCSASSRTRVRFLHLHKLCLYCLSNQTGCSIPGIASYLLVDDALDTLICNQQYPFQFKLL